MQLQKEVKSNLKQPSYETCVAPKSQSEKDVESKMGGGCM